MIIGALFLVLGGTLSPIEAALGLVVAMPVMAADTAKPVTFSKDVAPIFQAKCQGCHQPNSIATPLFTIKAAGTA